MSSLFERHSNMAQQPNKWERIYGIGVCIFIILVLCSCTPPQYHSITDSRTIEHKLMNGTELYPTSKKVFYCATHHKWEEVVAVYDTTLQKVYRVR